MASQSIEKLCKFTIDESHKDHVVALLKVYAKNKDSHEGIKLHADIEKYGLLDIPSIANALIGMYAKCGLLGKAHQVHDKMVVRSLVSWNIIISGHMQQGQDYEALNCFEQMQSEGHTPSVITLTCIVKALGNIEAIGQGMRIHDQIIRKGLLRKNVMLGNTLVYMYAKCSMLMEAYKVFCYLPVQNVVSWSALIAGYAQHHQGREALVCFEEMLNQGFFPDAVTFICILKACGSTGDVNKGKRIHDEIVNRGLLEENSRLSTALVDMYAKYGLLAEAQNIHNELFVRDVVSWSALIAGYVEENRSHEAFTCFKQMQTEGVLPNVVTFICILGSCGIIGSIAKGKQMHNEILSRGTLSKDISIGNALLDMYVKCGALVKAKEIFEEISVRDVVAWSILISGYTQQWQGHEAHHCFAQMQIEGVSPETVTFVHIFKACGITRSLEQGQKLHEEIVRRGLLTKDIALGTALINMYSECGQLSKAQEVHNELHVRSLISWNVLITGYVQQGQCCDAWRYFKLIQRDGLSPDVVTYISILVACSCMKAVDNGRKIHTEIISRGISGKGIYLGTALVDMYAKCDTLAEARRVHAEISLHDVISWSSVLAGYIQEGNAREVLNCFRQIQGEGLSPNAAIYTCALKACGSTGSIDRGWEVHNEIVGLGILEKDIALGNALVNMYIKCGMLSRAQEVLRELPMRNVVSWNTLISGFGHQGQVHEALNCFEWMQDEGLTPDLITFLCILNACAHSGLLHKAQVYFGDMRIKYGITPGMQHYTCMVTIFGRAGHFEKAMSLIEMMPSSDYAPVWLAIMSACRKWGNLELGRLAFHQAVQLDDKSAAYVLMADIYAAAGMHRDAEKAKAIAAGYSTGKKRG